MNLRRRLEALERSQMGGQPIVLHMPDGRTETLRGNVLELLAKAREIAVRERFTLTALPIIDTQIAKEKARTGDLDGAINLSRAVVDDEFNTGEMIWRGPAASVLAEALLRRDAVGDRQEAQEVIDRLAAVQTDPGFLLYEIPLLRLRALLARVHGDEVTYRELLDRYRARAASCGFEGHLAAANAMT